MKEPLLVLAVLTVMAAVAPGCVDNSGGPPPAGDEVAATRVASAGLSCGTFTEQAWLLRTDDDVQRFAQDCFGAGGPPLDQLRAQVEGVPAGSAIVVVNVSLGGCLRGFEVAGVFQEDVTLNLWVIKQDTSLGGSTACTDDLGEATQVLQVGDVADARAVRIVVGRTNPDLPGGPG